MPTKIFGEQAWKELISEIKKGNVIPIIGPELSKIRVDGQEFHLNDYLLKELINKAKVSQSIGDYTQLKYSIEWESFIDKEDTCMQYEINQLYQELKPAPSEYLKKLVKIKELKLILTTTFDNLTELALKENYGEKNVMVYNYEIKSKYYDLNETDFHDERKTILFHMFGKLGDLETSFVLTEDDLLKYMLNWINLSSSPKNLINYLQDKYLLVLGCNYPSWLFKFFLHAIKFNIERNVLNVVPKKSLVADFLQDNDLNIFLERLKTRFHCNPEAFIDELLARYQDDIKEEDIELKDIFISYAHEDEETVSKIVNELVNSKIGVWFDKNKDEQYGLETGDNFTKKIKRNIIRSKMFVPVLSKSVYADRRFFRKEWVCAINEAEKTYKSYIYPLIIDKDFNLDHEAIPQEFKEIHFLMVDMHNISDSLRPLIRLINKDKRIIMNPL